MHQPTSEVSVELPAEQNSTLLPWSLWLELVRENTSSKNPVVMAVTDEFLPRLKTAAPEIYAGQQGLSLDEDGSDRVLEELEKWGNEKQRRIIQHIFRCGLERGNIESRWLIALPPLRLSVERPVNPVRPRDFALLHPLASIESKFSAALSDLLKTKSNVVVAGALLFAAARRGGLVQKNRQTALLKISAQNVIVEGGVLRIELEDGSTWFPTPSCEIFLHAALRKKALPQTTSPQQAVGAGLKLTSRTDPNLTRLCNDAAYYIVCG